MLIDVREPEESARFAIPGAVNQPLLRWWRAFHDSSPGVGLPRVPGPKSLAGGIEAWLDCRA